MIAQIAQHLQFGVGQGARAAFALHRLDQDGRRRRCLGRRADGVVIIERHIDEAGQARTEAFQIGLVASGGHRGIGAAVEGALKTDDVYAFVVTLGGVIFARQLQSAFDRFRAGIGEEHLISEGGRTQFAGQFSLPWNGEDVGDMPQLLRLRGHGLDQDRIGVAQAVDGDALHEIEIFAARSVIKSAAFAALHLDRRPRIHTEQMIFRLSHITTPKTAKNPAPIAQGKEGV